MRAGLIVGGNLRARILTAAAMVPVVAAALYLGDWPLVVFLLAVSAGMGWEWGGLAASDSGPWPVRAAGAALTAALTAMAIAGVLRVVSPTVAAGAVVFILLAAAVFTRRQAVPRPRLFFFGMPVLVVGCTAVAWLRGDDLAGLWVVAWTVAVVILMDIGGYVFGRLIGGPRLMPRVSPNKTWAGLLGGVGAAALFGAVLGGAIEGCSGAVLAVWSALVALFSQAGDLAESAVKRHVGVKDSGAMLPGHGGLLDRVDGHLAALALVLGVAVVSGRSPLAWAGT